MGELLMRLLTMLPRARTMRKQRNPCIVRTVRTVRGK